MVRWWKDSFNLLARLAVPEAELSQYHASVPPITWVLWLVSGLGGISPDPV